MSELIHLHRLSELAEEFSSGQSTLLRDASLLVPSDAVSSVVVDVTDIPKRFLAQALPALLEDRVVDDISQLHLTYAQADSDHKLVVYIVKTETMQEWLDTCAVCGIRPEGMYPDFFSLPVPDTSLPVAIEDTYVTVRFTDHQGFAGNIDDVLALIQHVAPQLPMTVWTDGSIQGDLLPNIEQQLPLEAQPLLHGEAVNLLQGQYAPKSKPANVELRWPWGLMAASVVLLIALGLNAWSQTHYLAAQNQQLQRVNISSAQQLLGTKVDGNWLPYARYQQAIAHQYADPKRNQNWLLLRELNDLMNACSPCMVQEIVIENGTASLTLKQAGAETLLQQLQQGGIQVLSSVVREDLRVVRVMRGDAT